MLKILIPNMMVLGSETLGRWLGPESTIITNEPSGLWKRPQRALMTLLRHEDVANSPSSMNWEVAIIKPQVCQPPELWEIKLFCLSHPIYDNLPKWTKIHHAFVCECLPKVFICNTRKCTLLLMWRHSSSHTSVLRDSINFLS